MIRGCERGCVGGGMGEEFSIVEKGGMRLNFAADFGFIGGI